MTETALDELGPVDYFVVEFPAGTSNFTGEMARELLALVDAGTIRVIDILILAKNEDGTVEAMELSDIEELGELQALEAQLAELLAEEDVEHLAAAMEPGSVAGSLADQGEADRQRHRPVQERQPHDDRGDRPVVAVAGLALACGGPVVEPGGGVHLRPSAGEQRVVDGDQDRLVGPHQQPHHQPGQDRRHRLGRLRAWEKNRCAR